MSIYVGDKKAKLYRGDYGPAQFYKGDVKIAGYTDVEKVGTSISGIDTYNDALNLAIEGKSEQTVTANSPSPDHPEPIRSSENFDVVSIGRNLFDKRIYNGIVTYTADGFTYTNKEMHRVHSIPIPIDFKPNTQYTMSCDAKDSASTGNAIIFASFTDGSYQYLSTIKRDILTHYSKTTFQNRTVKYINISYAESATPTVITINHLQIAEGVIKTPYEPYHATTAHITDPLRSVGGVSDSIEVSEGKVEVVRRCKELPIQNWTRQFKVYDYGRFPVLSTLVKDSGATSIFIPNVISTHGKALSANDLVSKKDSGFSTAGELIYIFARLDPIAYGCTMTSTNEELSTKFTNWYASHKVQLFYPATPTRTDITATPLGQALLSLRTQPHYTQVYTNATLPPTIRARIKEMEL